MYKSKLVYKVILLLFLIAQFQFLTLLNLPPLTLVGTGLQFNPRFLSFVNPLRIDSAGLSSASATLSNPRLSFSGAVSGTVNAGAQVVTIQNSAFPDINTGNLFPNDNIAIGINGNLPVASISSGTVFTIKTPLPVTVGNSTVVYATQSGKLTVDFYTSAGLPNAGKIHIELPAAASNYNDGAPDSGASVSTSGFDLNGMGSSDVICPPGPFGAATVTAGSPQVIECTATAPVPAGAHFTVQIGTTKQLVNPAPVTTGHTQGQADIYPISIYTKDSGGNNIESVMVRTAPVEGVLVTATIDETLSFTVAGITADSGSYCGITRDANSPDTTAVAVPWNTINSDYAGNTTRHNTDQQLTVTTNAPTGYTVYAQENDQMGKDGNVCTGYASGSDYVYPSGSLCIRDANCGGGAYSTCTHLVSAEWAGTPNGYGFGFSLQNVPVTGGTDATFLYNESARTFSARQFSDIENASAAASLMSNTGPVSGSSVYVCYRIHIPAMQPAGYYFNKIRYTAVPKF